MFSWERGLVPAPTARTAAAEFASRSTPWRKSLAARSQAAGRPGVWRAAEGNSGAGPGGRVSGPAGPVVAEPDPLLGIAGRVVGLPGQLSKISASGREKP